MTSATRRDVTLSDGEVIPAVTVVRTAGMAASPLSAQVPGERDRWGRPSVDAHLRVVGVPDVHAAGDTAHAAADDGRSTARSCQHALPMSRFAGHDVAAELLGGDLLPFPPDPYVTCLALGPAGAVCTEGRQRALDPPPPTDDAERLLDQAGRLSNG
ncbi:FAD-dependent oxidoreductase [Streptomyces hilarionis]|uniref:FAD-dependent oxidoreductase n=1 Tax=Streptomyces hilarionis TaxID=2839954 RepID=UPI00211A110D|nr:FAD-dependent oxidoreductase [Streptomyces hilarionis]MCQ9130063.1 FAD-dependent oxidoreductase [Streptomyces hilarionis]